MAVAWQGWLDGLTAFGIIFFCVVFGLLSFYKSIKLKAKLLSVAGILMFFVGFLWLGPTVDFFVKLITGYNLFPPHIYVLLSYTWVAPALLFAMYLGGELLVSKLKWVLVGIFLVLGVVFELFLWFSPWQSFDHIQVDPLIPNGLIDASFNNTHPTFILVVVFLVSALIFLGIGSIIKAKQATGILRKKFVYMSIGFIIFVLSGALDSILTIPVAIGAVRVVMMTFSIWEYLGLKT